MNILKRILTIVIVAICLSEVSAQQVFTLSGFTFNVTTYSYPITEKIGDTIYVRGCQKDGFSMPVSVSPTSSSITIKTGTETYALDHISSFYLNKYNSVYNVYNGTTKIATFKYLRDFYYNQIDAIIVDGNGKEVPYVLSNSFITTNNLFVGAKYKKDGVVVKCTQFPFDNKLPLYHNKVYEFFDKGNLKNGDSIYYDNSFLSDCIANLCTEPEKLYSKTYHIVDNVTSIQDNLEANFTVYLNADKNTVIFSNIPTSLKNTSAEIINYSGQLVKTFAVENEVSIADVASGSYILLMQEKSGKLYTKRFIK